MAKVELKTLVSENFKKALLNLSEEKLPVSTAKKIANIMYKADEAVKAYDSFRLEQIEKLGDRDENGELKADEENTAQMTKENYNNLLEALREYLSQQVELPDIKFAELNDNVHVSPSDLLSLKDVLLD